MIDEKKLIEAIKDYFKEKIDNIDSETIDDRINCILKDNKAICGIIDRQPKVGEWIPCSERLPKTNGVYQVTREIFEVKYPYRIETCAYFDGQDTWHNDNRVNHGREYLKDILAWKPLDELYKE